MSELINKIPMNGTSPAKILIAISSWDWRLAKAIANNTMKNRRSIAIKTEYKMNSILKVESNGLARMGMNDDDTIVSSLNTLFMMGPGRESS
ncbi:hypothetical protein KDH_22070 [Dictyobacter sp. S3.2.2.5]|uniref:Uncharacterized protein n=1 Tax=Dictyobacter halimunensis TaxID=3026934 RepID=A0ABQ6FM85_9CHLR|nr:hypothetical protein KDH_22070 [Dictyobacter sp. S3.2.2.5]